MDEKTTREICTTLKDRLKEAENKLRTALSASGPDHPLASPARELLEIHTEIRDLLLEHFEAPAASSPTEDSPEIAMAAIQIEREAHIAKAEFMDVVKALFMWKDDPVERVRSDGQ